MNKHSVYNCMCIDIFYTNSNQLSITPNHSCQNNSLSSEVNAELDALRKPPRGSEKLASSLGALRGSDFLRWVIWDDSG